MFTTFHAGAMFEGEEDVSEVAASSSLLTIEHQRLGSSAVQCSVYGFLQQLLWPDTCAMQDFMSYNSR